ncbi:hypothetical protein [Endozoicomonas lisbonensis]|uniref:hypothetical protein n=1 Tax=Endozoicomonas lisbonensis TaxID=3120522 RepID=UPI003391BB4E
MGAGGIQNALDIDSTAEAGSYLDQGRYGYFSLLIQQLNRKQQVSYRLTDLHQVLPLVDPTKDTWISQAEFLLPNRRVVNLARIGLLFVDVDTYRMPWAKGRTPDQQVDSFLYFCEQAGVPQPSLVIWSGRGLHAKWLLDGTLPRQALPRWNACQRFLVDLLHETGADPRAKDASRVLRLVDTVNSRSQQVARVLHITSGTDDKPKRYDFEWLCEMLLPMARWGSGKGGKKAEKQTVAGIGSGRKRAAVVQRSSSGLGPAGRYSHPAKTADAKGGKGERWKGEGRGEDEPAVLADELPAAQRGDSFRRVMARSGGTGSSDGPELGLSVIGTVNPVP